MTLKLRDLSIKDVEELYFSAINLSKNGYGSRKISKKIFVSRPTVEAWINRDQKPRSLWNKEERERKKASKSNWKGGKRLNDNGYYMIWSPTHPKANGLGYVREHRLIMENHLGRYLTHDEKVHHINNIRTDNRIDNLQLTTLSEHSKESVKTIPRDSKGRFFKTQTPNPFPLKQ